MTETVTFTVRNPRTKRPWHTRTGELMGYLPDGRARVKVAGVVTYVAREDLIDGKPEADEATDRVC